MLPHVRGGIMSSDYNAVRSLSPNAQLNYNWLGPLLVPHGRRITSVPTQKPVRDIIMVGGLSLCECGVLVKV